MVESVHQALTPCARSQDRSRDSLVCAACRSSNRLICDGLHPRGHSTCSLSGWDRKGEAGQALAQQFLMIGLLVVAGGPLSHARWLVSWLPLALVLALSRGAYAKASNARRINFTHQSRPAIADSALFSVVVPSRLWAHKALVRYIFAQRGTDRSLQRTCRSQGQLKRPLTAGEEDPRLHRVHHRPPPRAVGVPAPAIA
jgi:hypothetical protein